jgi:glutamate-1-semialdehyde 2,1-aminomutase
MHYPSFNSASAKLHERALKYLPGGNTRTTVYMKPYPIYAVRGAGCRVWDADGDVRIDCINNFTSHIHGYANPTINAVVKKQLENGTAFGLPTSSEIDLAELLCSRVESIERVRFTNSGTEAVMMAIKAARAFTGRVKIAKVEGAYHGSYDYAEVSLDSQPKEWGDDTPSSIPYAKGTPSSVLTDVITIPFNDPEMAVKLLRLHAGELAAVLIDPVPNRAGLIPASQQFITSLVDTAKEIGALLIFDEVISFRLCYRGAQSLWDVKPDLTALGKIIGGGFPIGAVGGREDVMAVFDPTYGKPALPHGGTFSANPISMTAGLAAMQLLDRKSFKRLDEMGASLRAAINKILIARNLVGQAVGMGSLIKVHLTSHDVKDYRSAFQDSETARKLSVFVQGLMNRGVLVASNGLIALSTPMTNEDLDLIIQAVEGAVDDVLVSMDTI